MLEIDYRAFGRRLQDIRRSRHLTQEKLSEIVDVSFQYISMLECGRRSPSVEMLFSLCCALNCTCEELLKDSFPDSEALIFRDSSLLFRNTLTNWVLDSQPDESLQDNTPADLAHLPPLGFSTLDGDDFPPICS